VSPNTFQIDPYLPYDSGMATRAPISDSAPAPTVLIDIYEVVRRTGYERSTIYSYIKQGTFPRPVKNRRSSRWDEAEVQQWIDQLKVQRTEDPAGWEKHRPKNAPTSPVQAVPQPPIETAAVPFIANDSIGQFAQMAKLLSGNQLLRLRPVMPEVCIDPVSGAVYLHIFDFGV